MKNILIGIPLAIIVILFTTALGLAFIHITDIPYIIDIENLGICEKTGLSRGEILLNYNAAMNYLSPFSSENFALPTLRYSKLGIYHFAQCKTLFNTVYLAGLFSAIFLIMLTIKKVLSRRTLWISGISVLIIPALLITAMSINFDRAFTFFHSIFFDGTTWLFNPKVDQIINILPMTFFMHCAYLILFFWFVGAAVMLIISFLNKKHTV
jgi:integral membrane protein (TIGR01906 family)